MIIQHFGTDAYAQYGLLSSFPTLLPFADLGIAAVVINAVAGSSDAAHRRLRAAHDRRPPSASCSCPARIIVAVGVVITLAGWWPAAARQGADRPTAAASPPSLCLAIFGLVLPLTVGQRILVGLKTTSTQVASQAVVAPFMFLGDRRSSRCRRPAGSYLAVVSYIGNALVSVICLIVAARALKPQVGQRHPRRAAAPPRTERPRASGSPGRCSCRWSRCPIAMQTDRLLLSHLTTGRRARPVQPRLPAVRARRCRRSPPPASRSGRSTRGARAEPRSSRRPKPTLWFLARRPRCSGGALAVLSPLARRLRRRRPDHARPLAARRLRRVRRPAGGEVPDRHVHDRQARPEFQVVPMLVMVPLNLGLSWWLIGVIGAAGPCSGRRSRRALPGRPEPLVRLAAPCAEVGEDTTVVSGSAGARQRVDANMSRIRPASSLSYFASARHVPETERGTPARASAGDAAGPARYRTVVARRTPTGDAHGGASRSWPRSARGPPGRSRAAGARAACLEALRDTGPTPVSAGTRRPGHGAGAGRPWHWLLGASADLGRERRPPHVPRTRARRDVQRRHLGDRPLARGGDIGLDAGRSAQHERALGDEPRAGRPLRALRRRRRPSGRLLSP